MRDIVIQSEERLMRLYHVSFDEFSISFREDALIDLIQDRCAKRRPLGDAMIVNMCGRRTA